jgi:tRNA pseudouridine38-40 synthase
VQQVLEEALAVMTGRALPVVGASRTDAGVHARRQVAHFHTDAPIPPPHFLRGLNSLLPADIVVRELAEVDGDFHAHRQARSKLYLYQIWNRPVPTALERHRAWHVRCPLRLEAMAQAVLSLRGTHDFTSFCTVHTEVMSRVRTVLQARFEERDGMIRFFIEADGFLRYMVRTIVGTLVDVGRGKRSPADMERLLSLRDRRHAGATAPPQGLFLMEVNY